MISAGTMPASRRGTVRTSTSMPRPPLAAISLVAQHRPAPPRSWMPTTRSLSKRARQASIRRFSSNGSPTCTLGRLASSPSENSADASTLTPPMPSRPGGGAEQDGQVAHALGAGQHEPLVAHDADAGHVDQGIAREALPDRQLAAHGGHADGVAVAGDPADHALHDPAVAGAVEGAEVQRVEQGDRPGAHGEDVADDPAHAGGRPLVGLDGGRVVVALDAQGDGDPVADVDHAGVLTEAGEDPRRLEGEAAEVDARRLVGAVLGPHDRVHGQLEVVGRPAEEAGDGLRFVVGEAKLAVKGKRHRRKLPDSGFGLKLPMSAGRQFGNACKDEKKSFSHVGFPQGGFSRRPRAGKSGTSLSGSARGPQAEAGPQAHTGIGARRGWRRSRRGWLMPMLSPACTSCRSE